MERIQKSRPRERALGLFGSEVVAKVAPVHTSVWAESLLPAEAKLVNGAPPRRQREFLAGRSLARLSLAEMGIAPAPLLRDSDRCPVWPKNAVGSISHSRELCVVVVTGSTRCRSLGIDVESDQGLERKLRDRICLPSEVEGLSEAEARVRAKLLFSIKEAVYKCQFPISRARLGFHDVEVQLDPKKRHFRAHLRVDSASRAAAPIIEGEYAWQLDHVFCFAQLPA